MCTNFSMVPLLPRKSVVKRVMNIYKLNCAQFQTTKDITKVQNALQEHGKNAKMAGPTRPL